MAKHRKQEAVITRGPRRWERAAANALVKPNSKGARLYLRRTSLAYQVSEECRNSMDVSPDQAYQHMRLDYLGGGIIGEKRENVTCSVFCTVMVLQLRFQEGTLEAIGKAFSENHKTYSKGEWIDSGIPKVKQLNKGDLKGRTATCFYCGSKVK